PRQDAEQGILGRAQADAAQFLVVEPADGPGRLTQGVAKARGGGRFVAFGAHIRCKRNESAAVKGLASGRGAVLGPGLFRQGASTNHSHLSIPRDTSVDRSAVSRSPSRSDARIAGVFGCGRRVECGPYNMIRNPGPMLSVASEAVRGCNRLFPAAVFVRSSHGGA